MIDTHQHLLYPDLFSYPWVGDIPALAGNFRLEEYRAASAGCGITGALFMEVDAEQSAAEARFFCELAGDAGNAILGVVASGRPEHDGFGDYLDKIASPKLAG
ncbi:MAG: amidohydrolase, partial [Chthoniobacterales bacterium]|nr:amidohydrolase [Chthoniobacterales bacterium]